MVIEVGLDSGLYLIVTGVHNVLHAGPEHLQLVAEVALSDDFENPSAELGDEFRVAIDSFFQLSYLWNVVLSCFKLFEDGG